MFQEQVFTLNERTNVVKILSYLSTKFTFVGINSPDDILTQIGASARIPKISKVQH